MKGIIIAVFIYCLFPIIDGKIRMELQRLKSPRQNAVDQGDLTELGVTFEQLFNDEQFPTNQSIGLKRWMDSEYYGEVKVGSRNVIFNVIFDTAWTTSWLISADCPSTSTGCWFHNKYDHSRSNTYRENGTKYSINEGAYTLSGYWSTENFAFQQQKVKSMNFVEMTNVPYFFVFSKSDGVMGMCLPYGSTKTFLQILLEQGSIKEAIFAIYYNRNPLSNRGGDIMLGFYDPKYIHVTNKQPDPITYVPVYGTSGLWDFDMDGITIGHKGNYTTVCPAPCRGYIASGSVTIIGPAKQIELINLKIGARVSGYVKGRYEVDCGIIAKLPKINFNIKGANFTLSGKEYVHKTGWKSIHICLTTFVMPSNAMENQWVLGGAFLSTYYTIYDMDKKEIGMVKAA